MAKAKRRNVTKKRQAGFMYGSACGEQTRSGGKCVLTKGHSGGHRKA